jgi:hypothetical protein
LKWARDLTIEQLTEYYTPTKQVVAKLNFKASNVKFITAEEEKELLSSVEKFKVER